MDKKLLISLLCFTSTVFGNDNHGGDVPSIFIRNVGKHSIELVQTNNESVVTNHKISFIRPHQEIELDPNTCTLEVNTLIIMPRRDHYQRISYELPLKSQNVWFDLVTKSFGTNPRKTIHE